MENAPRDIGTRRSALAAWVGLLLVVAGAITVFALPGPPARKYPERIPVRFWHMWTAEWRLVVERIVDRFNESQDIYEVIPLSVPGTAADSKFLLSVAGGDPPDVMAQWNPVIPKWADNGLIVPLNELMTPQEWTDFKTNAYPAAKRMGMYKDQLYGITTGLNIWSLFCRLDHLQEAGLDPAQFPETLEGLSEWAAKLNRFDAQKNMTRMGFVPQWFYMYAPGFGPGFYDWDKGCVTLDTPGNERALSYLVEERRKVGFDNVVRFMSGLTLGLGNADWPFITGAFSITVDGQWRVEQLARYAPDLKYVTKAIPPPKGGRPHYCWVNGNFMIIPKGAKQTRGAWEFIKFWSGVAEPERAAEFYTWGGWLPLSPAITNAPVYREYVRNNPQFATFLEVLPSENAQPVPPVPYQVYLWDRIIQADDAAMRGSLTPRQALDRLEREIAEEVASRREFGYAD